MKKIIVLLLLPLLFCGCVEMEQIEELAFVKIVGIDKTGDGLTVSVGIKLPENEQGAKNSRPGFYCGRVQYTFTRTEYDRIPL